MCVTVYYIIIIMLYFASVPCDECDTDGCAKVSDEEGVCFCLELGKQCVGDCNGTLTAISDGSQSCEGQMLNLT